MNSVALVTGADRGLGLGLTEALLVKGWIVIAGKHFDWPELEQLATKFPETLHTIPLDVSSDESVKKASQIVSSLVDHVDLVINNAALNRSHQIASIRQPQDFDNMIDEVNINAIGALRVVEAFLPLVERSQLKRLCFVSSEAGSIGASNRTGWFGYCMSKAALNMAVKNLHNDLGPLGFTFRLYQPGYMKTYMAGTKNENAHMEPDEAAGYALKIFLDNSELETFAMIDWEGKEWPW